MKENPIFFDDKIRLKVNNYEGASTALQLVEDMSASDFENVLHGKDAKRKTKTSADVGKAEAGTWLVHWQLIVFLGLYYPYLSFYTLSEERRWQGY